MSKYVSATSQKTIIFKDTKTGKPITNPVIVKDGTRLTVKEAPKPTTWTDPIKNAFSAIGNAIGNFIKDAKRVNG